MIQTIDIPIIQFVSSAPFIALMIVALIYVFVRFLLFVLKWVPFIG